MLKVVQRDSNVMSFKKQAVFRQLLFREIEKIETKKMRK